jgi:predicted nuclease with TOPRIM domain
MFDFGSAAVGVVAGVVGLYLFAELTFAVASKRRRAKEKAAFIQVQIENLQYANDRMFTRLSELDGRIRCVEGDLAELEETVEDLEDEVDDLDDRATSQDETDLLWEYLDHSDARLVTVEARLSLLERVQDEKLTELDTVLAAHINSDEETPRWHHEYFVEEGGTHFYGGYTDDGIPFVIAAVQEATDE